MLQSSEQKALRLVAELGIKLNGVDKEHIYPDVTTERTDDRPLHLGNSLESRIEVVLEKSGVKLHCCKFTSV